MEASDILSALRHHETWNAQRVGQTSWRRLGRWWSKGPHLLLSTRAAQSINAMGSFQSQQADLLNGNAAFSDPVSHHLLQGSKGQQKKEEISWCLRSTCNTDW